MHHSSESRQCGSVRIYVFRPHRRNFSQSSFHSALSRRFLCDVFVFSARVYARTDEGQGKRQLDSDSSLCGDKKNWIRLGLGTGIVIEWFSTERHRLGSRLRCVCRGHFYGFWGKSKNTFQLLYLALQLYDVDERNIAWMCVSTHPSARLLLVRMQRAFASQERWAELSRFRRSNPFSALHLLNLNLEYSIKYPAKQSASLDSRLFPSSRLVPGRVERTLVYKLAIKFY